MARLQKLKLPKGVEIDEVSNDNFFTYPSARSVPTTLAVKDYLHDEINKHDQEFMPDSMYRNAIINGNFDIWQRGTNFDRSSKTGKYYSADRWYCFRGGYQSGTIISRQLCSLPGSQYCIRCQRAPNDTNTDYIKLVQTLEHHYAKTLCRKKITLSCKIRLPDNNSFTRVNMYMSDNLVPNRDETSGTSLIFGSSAAVYPGNDWQNATCIGNPTRDGALAITFQPTIDTTATVGNNDYFEVAQVQLNIGDKPLPFSPRPYAEELALCQRYFERIGYGVAANFVATGVCTSATSATAMMRYVQKRVTPTVTFSSQNGFRLKYGNGTAQTVSLSALDQNINSCSVSATVSGGLTDGFGCVLRTNSDTDYIDINAEL